MIIAIYICSILLLSTSNLHITAVEFVKTHHVKTLLENYMNLNDNQLRSILTPGVPLHRFRLAVSDLKNSFEAIDSKIWKNFIRKGIIIFDIKGILSKDINCLRI